MTVRRLETHPIHLGRGATAVPQPEFPRDDRAMQWYADYGARHAADGAEGRLVSMFSWTEDWPGWEMHPAGPEIVLCTSGRMILHQEFPGGRIETLTLEPGDYAINPQGVWHTADVDGHATGVFVTVGEGTQGRPR
jgi:quercetin dioxygenase-like cupin family protein